MALEGSESTLATQAAHEHSKERHSEVDSRGSPEKDLELGSPEKDLELGKSREDGKVPVARRSQDQNSPEPSGNDVEKGPQADTLAPAPTHDPNFEVSFNGVSDPMNPRGRYSTAQKWIFVVICSTTSFCVTCASSLYTATYEQLEPEFGASEIVVTLGLSLFVVGLGLGPMLLGPLSEVCSKQKRNLLAEPADVETVLWPQTDLHRIVILLCDMADTLCRCAEYPDNGRSLPHL